MTFEEVLDQAIAMLQRRGRLTYRTLQLHFQLDDEHLEALKDELMYGQRLAVDPVWNVVCFLAEQCAEKYVIGFFRGAQHRVSEDS